MVRTYQACGRGNFGLEEVKVAAAKRWVAAVNADGTYGTWAYAIAKKVADVATILSQMGD